MSKGDICSVEGCEKICTNRRSVCEMHYARMLRHGSYTHTAKQGQTNHYLYKSWCQMHRRCKCKNDTKYKLYGERGITVCERWSGHNGFWNFYNDMGDRPDGYSLDRIDVDGNYCPENCRWADAKTQANNRQRNKQDECA